MQKDLVSFYTYGNIALNPMTLYSNQSSMEGTLFLGASGNFIGEVFKVLANSLDANQLELVYHCTLSKCHCVMGVRCLSCNFACTIGFSKHTPQHWPALRSSLARWLGVQVEDVPGPHCWVTGQYAMLRNASANPFEHQ